jgi:Ca2+-binding EF-hand superfamily protein
MRAGSQDWRDLITQLDTNQDNKIDYGEFITAAVNRTRLLTEDNLRMAFEMFDKDGNGQISTDELRAVFHGGLCHAALDD